MVLGGEVSTELDRQRDVEGVGSGQVVPVDPGGIVEGEPGIFPDPIARVFVWLARLARLARRLTSRKR